MIVTDHVVSFRFGNYIGEGGLSDEESQHGDVPAQDYTYGESEEEDEAEANDQQLMEVDGARNIRPTS
jgi:hypothetical protein